MDTNKDGKATKEEILAYMMKTFYGPEKAKEHQLTPEKADETAKSDADDYLKELDINNDGALDLDELTAHYKDDETDLEAELDAETKDGDDDAGDDVDEVDEEEEDDE